MPRVKRRARRFDFTDSCKKQLIVGADPARFCEHFPPGYGEGAAFDREAAARDWSHHGEAIENELAPVRPWAHFVFDKFLTDHEAREAYRAQFSKSAINPR